MLDAICPLLAVLEISARQAGTGLPEDGFGATGAGKGSLCAGHQALVLRGILRFLSRCTVDQRRPSSTRRCRVGALEAHVELPLLPPRVRREPALLDERPLAKQATDREVAQFLDLVDVIRVRVRDVECVDPPHVDRHPVPSGQQSSEPPAPITITAAGTSERLLTWWAATGCGKI